MIYIVALIYFLWNKRYIILTVFGVLFTIISAVIGIIEADYFEFMMLTSVGLVITINSALSELFKQEKENKSRNRHR